MSFEAFPISEHAYEEWFDKYLGNIESLDKAHPKSPLQNMPKPYSPQKWICVNMTSCLLTLAASLLFAYLSVSNDNQWLLNWVSGALLNLSLGLIASFMILAYTNRRDQNTVFYTDIIPLLTQRYADMREAYFDFTFGMSRYEQSGEYEKCYASWHAHSNTCFVILNFIDYLLTIVPFKSRDLTITKTDIENAKEQILSANQLIQTEYFGTQTISKETSQICTDVTYVGMECLQILSMFIEELTLRLYGVKYGKRTKTAGEAEEEKRREEMHKTTDA